MKVKCEICVRANYCAKDGDEVKSVFNLLAVVVGLLGLIQILDGLFQEPPHFMIFVSGLAGLLHAYAWYLVGDLWVKVESLRVKVRSLGDSYSQRPS